MTTFDLLAFDADDTLWDNERLFTMTQEKFGQLLAPYLDRPWDPKTLYTTEIRNLRYFGYGIKGYALSMIETALELTGNRLPGAEIKTIIDYAKAMIEEPVRLMDQVAEVVPRLAAKLPLMLITKGDLFDQTSKLARSGLAEHFAHVEVVPDKTPEIYRRILARYRVPPERFVMVGNALKSDILPVLELGGYAIYVPYAQTWAHEHAERPADNPHFHEVGRLDEVPSVLEQFFGWGA